MVNASLKTEKKHVNALHRTLEEQTAQSVRRNASLIDHFRMFIRV